MSSEQAYASSETDPFEYTYQGKILTKPYIEEIDRLMTLGYTQHDECVLKLIRKLTLVINPDATTILPMSVINYARNTLKPNVNLKRFIFGKQEKERIETICKMIQVYKANGKELIGQMMVIEKGLNENGDFDVNLLDLEDIEEYYSFKFQMNSR
jgi:hypothetical protein